MDHTNSVHLSHPQSKKDFLAQYYARLSLADMDADKKSPIPATAPSTITVTPEAPAQQSQIVTETTGTGATSLTITTVTGIAGTSTRTITGPDGTVLVPPPIPAHPGCELCPQMAKAMEDFAIEHCCDYMKAKDYH
ncbi:hypothetical protein QBC32DRAFT_355684 [Pseudoneurospora amorphoporcata]|uniref:Uncharacterized protein n=1 Tax=Pseudoneurospora amorphoporcata TaxID=241081 RepID=A0AAN6NKZ1_9PEZI|nr:hypothetical protein QBC32DRAFT_355684 [Pseudoneurospora amorphoporcata]